jgi:hypothetical protein
MWKVLTAKFSQKNIHSKPGTPKPVFPTSTCLSLIKPFRPSNRKEQLTSGAQSLLQKLYALLQQSWNHSWCETTSSVILSKTFSTWCWPTLRPKFRNSTMPFEVNSFSASVSTNSTTTLLQNYQWTSILGSKAKGLSKGLSTSLSRHYARGFKWRHPGAKNRLLNQGCTLSQTPIL